jgi:LemA protein
MGKGRIIGLSVLVLTGLLVLILGIGVISGYNSLIEADEDVNFKYSEIANNLKSRHDRLVLMTNAVTGLQEYALEVYNMITEAREAYANAYASQDPAAMAEADNLTSIALTNLMAVVEDNDDLQVTAVYSQYISEVSSMESELTYARYLYNKSVADYNLRIRKFPQNIIAKMFGYSLTRTYWELPEGEGELPDVLLPV